MLAAGKPSSPTINQLAAIMPTYTVHSYYDTGQTITVRGKTHPLLLPLTSFGYFVQHDGSMEGWTDRLDGAQQIGPNLYKISVPNNGKAVIRTTITAVESTYLPGTWPWWLWLFLILLILFVLWLLLQLCRRWRPA